MRKYVDLYYLLSLRSSLADRCVALVDIETYLKLKKTFNANVCLEHIGTDGNLYIKNVSYKELVAIFIRNFPLAVA